MDRVFGVAEAVPFSGMTCRGGAGLQPAYEVRMLCVMVQCLAGKWNMTLTIQAFESLGACAQEQITLLEQGYIEWLYV